MTKDISQQELVIRTMGVGKECDNRYGTSTAIVGSFNAMQHALNAMKTSLPQRT